MPARVGVMVNAWPSGSVPSGTGRQAQLLARELTRRGVGVHVLVLETASASRTALENDGGVDVRRVWRPRTTLRSAHSSVAARRELMSWLKDVIPDLIHVIHPGTVGTAGPALVAAAGFPVVASVCDGLYGCAMGHLVNPLITRPLCTLPVGIDECSTCMAAGTGLEPARFTALQGERRAAAAASAAAGPFIADSAFMGAAIGRTVVGDHRVLPLPVEVGPVPRTSTAADRPLRVGYFGPPQWRKGIDVLLAAVDGLGDVELHVHGPRDHSDEPIYAAAVRERADRLPNVVWHPAYDPAEVAVRMADVDVVAVPSRAESLPGVAKEALAVGRPVLAAAIAGLPEIIVPGVTGWLIEDTEPTSWRHALAGLDADTVRAMRPSMRRTTADYVDELLPLYSDVLGSWPARATAEPWRRGLDDAAAICAGDDALRADERFQEAVADLWEGRRARAARGMVASLRRDATDRLLVTPAWLGGLAFGAGWAEDRVVASQQAYVPGGRRSARMRAVALALVRGTHQR